jgi:hypothetical protein
MNNNNYSQKLIQEYIELYLKALPLVKKDMGKSGRKYNSIQFIRFDTELENFICVADVYSNNGCSKTQLNVSLDYIVELLHKDKLKKEEKQLKLQEEAAETARLIHMHPNGHPKKRIDFQTRDRKGKVGPPVPPIVKT